MGASKISLKLLIDNNNNKVLFAEAGKNCVDFLFHLLSLPLGTIVKLLRKQQMIGSLENLYDSIKNLDEAYIQPNQNKDIFLSPKSPAGTPASPVTLLTHGDDSVAEKNIGGKAFYMCSSNSCSSNCYNSYSSSKYVSDDPRAVCPQCSRTMSSPMKYVAPPQTRGSGAGDTSEGGFVKGVVTYMIMDDLEVKPMSTISGITLLNEFNVKNLSALKEKVVDLGMNKALKLLKASLESKTVLTDVFLDNGQK